MDENDATRQRLDDLLRSADERLDALESVAEGESPPVVVPASVPEPEASTYVLFLPSASGYVLVERDGPVPSPGEIVDGEYVVAKVVRSPLPDDPRLCAYLSAI